MTTTVTALIYQGKAISTFESLVPLDGVDYDTEIARTNTDTYRYSEEIDASVQVRIFLTAYLLYSQDWKALKDNSDKLIDKQEVEKLRHLYKNLVRLEQAWNHFTSRWAEVERPICAENLIVYLERHNKESQGR